MMRHPLRLRRRRLLLALVAMLSAGSATGAGGVPSASVNLANLLAAPHAFFGFTAGSGAATSDHDILSWSLVQVPEPRTGILIALGVALLAGGSRRRAGLPSD
jgi:hypothetical protein